MIFNIKITIAVIFQAFSVVFQMAISKAEPAEEVSQRIKNLIDCISYSVFQYTSRGLFECDKLIFASQMTFQVRKISFCWDPSSLLKVILFHLFFTQDKPKQIFIFLIPVHNLMLRSHDVLLPISFLPIMISWSK